MQTVLKAEALEVATMDDGELNDVELDHISGGNVIQEAMAGLKLMGEILSNVAKTRSEIAMTFARNARA